MAARSQSLFRLLFSMAACALLASCLVESLWSWHDPERVPDVKRSVDSLEAREVRAPDGRRQADRLAVAVAPRDPHPQAGRIRRLAGEDEAWLRLARLPDVAAARGGPLAAFEPLSYDLDVFDGQHLRRSTFNARLRSYGKVDRSLLGREVPAGEVPLAIRRQSIHLHPNLRGGLLGRIIDGFEAQDWLSLVGDQPQGIYRQSSAVAFLAPDGSPLTGEQMLDALLGTEAAARLPAAEDCSLLGRYEESDDLLFWVSIPIPILLEATEMEFLQRGDEVAFAHDQAWRGRFQLGPIASSWTPYAVPMRGDTIAYQWTAELPNDRPLLYALSTIATPVAAVLDFVLASNVTIAAILREMLAPLISPARPRRNDR